MPRRPGPAGGVPVPPAAGAQGPAHPVDQDPQGAAAPLHGERGGRGQGRGLGAQAVQGGLQKEVPGRPRQEVREKTLTIFSPKTIAKYPRKFLHGTMCEYFLGTWSGGKEKPFKYGK